MNDKIQALAEKIYKDGVEKATSEAESIISSAQAEKKEIIAEAQDKAKEIIAQAKAEAEKVKAQAEGEIRMSVSSAREALETELTDLLANQAVTDGVNEAFSSAEAFYDIVLRMSEQMIEQNSNGLTISTSDAQQLTAYFQSKASHLLEKGINIKEVQGCPTEFEIAPKSGNYKISISKEAFLSYFREFLRPSLRKLLFDNTSSQEG